MALELGYIDATSEVPCWVLPDWIRGCVPPSGNSQLKLKSGNRCVRSEGWFRSTCVGQENPHKSGGFSVFELS